MSVSVPRPPGTVELKEMAVTQFVSVLLYTSVFVTIVVNADFVKTGFGGIPKELFLKYATREEHGTLFFIQLLVLGSIVALNAVRYHLSFWSVEENEGFKTLCEWARNNQLRRYTVADLSLRILSYVVLFLLQLSCARKGGRPEYFLVLLFALLVGWDILVLRLAYRKEQKESEAVAASFDPQVASSKKGFKAFWKWLRHDCRCAIWLKGGNRFWKWMIKRDTGADTKVNSFKIDVCRWLVAEGVALIGAIVYSILISVAVPNMGPIQTAMLLTLLGLVSFGLAGWDILFANRAKYKPILPILVALSVALVIVLRLLELDRQPF